MINLLQFLLDWSEVWAPLIPLIYYIFNRAQPAFLKPVIIYLVVAFFINLTGNIISDFKNYLPSWMQSNNPLYNAHSVFRFICFGFLFMGLRQSSFVKLRYLLTIISILLILINFIFIENFGNPDHLSGNLLAVEAYLLLIYCLLYYLSKLREDDSDIASGPDFWVVTGLGIYVVINFFVFLFYVPMIYHDSLLAERIWNIHNIAYILLCIFITRAFYDSARHQFAV
jgi:hypothetical protein